jgi:PTS system mannose-specific IID component
MTQQPTLPVRVRGAILLRLLAVQGAWNYETMVGNGIGFAMEPALRLLPGGRDGAAYREALARQSQYFNAHPYLASVAVGAMARAELDGTDTKQIERFRIACCGPLGSVGDQLVWAAWLPLCAWLSLAAFGLGGSPTVTVLTFLISYNLGHLSLRVWGLHVGYRSGLRVAGALGAPVLRSGPAWISRAGALVAGVAVPLFVQRTVSSNPYLVSAVVAAVAAGGLLAMRLRGRYELWKFSLGFLALIILAALVAK